MAAQENPVEKYGMSRYDAKNGRSRTQEGAFQRRDGNQARDEARAAMRETQAPTFSQLQSEGRARPAPPPPAPPPMPMAPDQGFDQANSMNTYQTGIANQAYDRMQNGNPLDRFRYDRMMNNPSSIPSAPRNTGMTTIDWSPSSTPRPAAAATTQSTLSPAVNPINTGQPGASVQTPQNPAGWDAIRNSLEEMFAGQRRSLDEEMARRGMWASTGDLGYGGAAGRLMGRQANALATARTDYQLQEDQQYNDLLRILLPIIMGG